MEPNPEQTASILSRMVFNYMDAVVMSASRTSHLTLDELPPLPDTDSLKILESRTFKVRAPTEPINVIISHLQADF